MAHPQVFRPRGLPKEVHFFDSCHPLWQDVGVISEGYFHYFPRPLDRIVGEWTPRYLYDFWVAPLLSQIASEARLLVIVRDPVERFRSGLTLSVRLANGMSKTIVNEAFQRGFYWAQLERLLRWVDADNLLLLQYERCVQEPARHLATTYAFLGVDPSYRPLRLLDRVNATAGQKVRLPAESYWWLREAYAEDSSQLARQFPEVDLELWGLA